MRANTESPYAGKGGLKLEFALSHFDVDVSGSTAADLGSNVGGFVDCLLRAGAARVYSVDTSYGTLAWELRNDDRVVVMERQNAMYVELPEKVGVVTVDVGWTPQRRILPHALTLVREGGTVLSLLKPQYESSEDERVKGVVKPECIETVVNRTVAGLRELGIVPAGIAASPIVSSDKHTNQEFFLHIRS